MRGHLDRWERHIRILQGLSERSVHIYRAKVEDFLAWLGSKGKTVPASLERTDIEDYLEHCFYRGNSNATRLTKLVAIRKFIRYLVYEKILEADITSQIPSPRLPKHFIPTFTKPEILRLFAAINVRTERGIRDAVILILAVFAGLRLAEIHKLKIADISEDERNVDINILKSKHAKGRVVYLWRAPSQIVQRWISIRISQDARYQDPLFIPYRRTRPAGNTPLSTSGITKIFLTYVTAAGIRKPAPHLHMLRATHAEDLRHVQGYDTPAIAERLGHKNISTTDRYLPRRGRVHRIYPSLSAYWKDFATVWNKRSNDDVSSQPSDHDHGGAKDV